jgi:hypothetical protein
MTGRSGLAADLLIELSADHQIRTPLITELREAGVHVAEWAGSVAGVEPLPWVPSQTMITTA